MARKKRVMVFEKTRIEWGYDSKDVCTRHSTHMNQNTQAKSQPTKRIKNHSKMAPEITKTYKAQLHHERLSR